MKNHVGVEVVVLSVLAAVVLLALNVRQRLGAGGTRPAAVGEIWYNMFHLVGWGSRGVIDTANVPTLNE